MPKTLTRRSDASPARHRRVSRRDVALVLGIPAAWAVTLLFHPTGQDWYPTVSDNLAAWQAVHLAMIAFIPLMAFVLHRLIRGIDNTAARACRAALPVFAVSYGAFEAVMGVGTGLLVSGVDDLPSSDRDAGATLVDAYTASSTLGAIELIASISCGIAFVSAALALQRAAMAGALVVAMVVVAGPLIAIHSPPFGPIGLGLFVVAAAAVLRHRPTPAPAPTVLAATHPGA